MNFQLNIIIIVNDGMISRFNDEY